MKRNKRLISTVMCLVMVISLTLGLTGCGGKDNAAGSGDSYVYVPQYANLSVDFSDGIRNAVYSNGWFYFLADVMAENSAADMATEKDYAYDPWETRLYKMDMDGNVTHMAGYQSEKLPENTEGYFNVQGLDADEDGNVYMLECKSLYNFDLPAGFDENTDSKWDYYTGSSNTYRLLKLDGEGNIVTESDLSGLALTENDYVQNMICQDGFFYIALDSKVAVLDESGALAYTYENENGWINSLVKLGDGKVCVSVYNDGYQLIHIDPVAKTGDVYCEKLPDNAWDVVAGSGEYDVFYTNGANLYGVKFTDGVATEEKVLNWISCDIDSDYVRTFAAKEDGVIVALSQDWSNDSANVELVTLTKTAAKDVAQKEVLTLATQYLDGSTKKAVLKFNKTNPNYRIEIKDYSEYNTEDDYEAGVKKLTTEILSGDMPDILYTSSLPMKRLAAKGLLLDLYPLMEGDSGVNKDDLMPKIREALEIDGKLYQTCSSFGVITVMGNADVVGTTPGWTAEELIAAYEKMPDGCDIFSQGMTRSDMLQYMLMLDEDSYVDWSTSQCNFDSEAFVDLLEFIKLFPSEFDWENYDYSEYESDQSRIANGKQMLMMAYLSDFSDMQYNMSAFQGKGVFIGFPTSEGVGNVLSLNEGYAISSKCKAPEAAWEFVRYFMSDEYADQYSYGFSTSQKRFNEQLKEAMTPEYEKDENGNFKLDENGNKIEISQGGWSDGVNEYNFYAMTQAEADQLVELINSCDKVMTYDTSLFDIVNEEVQGFFNDQKSAEETAKMVQSRVSLYVKEQA